MTYRVELSESAEEEIELAYLWILSRSPRYAREWYKGLLQAIASLSGMPYRCPVARETDYFDQEIRQLLYGAGRNAYRVLYLILEPLSADAEPRVRVLHVRHAARRTLGETG